ncbi:TetR/AcrR family transcriptional regulator [Lolliginicoccus levis]|uniref:TetR/AcrR family transcriptional regulator n=1 Tax=Lolliginicoccus levis TaxID=2919542 RepID=UPI00241E9B47|nr:TetR/AcrR family transcriptional regulator [Lolliginicoccus levis]
MPRTADHAARHRQIYNAVRAIADDEGLAAVTISRTAETASISVGLVQHYFPRKESLLIATHRTLIGDIEERVAELVDQLENQRMRIEHIMQRAMQELLPLDEHRRAEASCMLAFAGLALRQPEFAAESRRWQARLRELIAQAVRNARECGEVDASEDEHAVAWRVSQLVRGLSWTLFEDPRPETRASGEESLSTLISTIFSGPCNRAADASFS